MYTTIVVSEYDRQRTPLAGPRCAVK